VYEEGKMRAGGTVSTLESALAMPLVASIHDWQYVKIEGGE
jgi:hypothetical protein